MWEWVLMLGGMRVVFGIIVWGPDELREGLRELEGVCWMTVLAVREVWQYPILDHPRSSKASEAAWQQLGQESLAPQGDALRKRSPYLVPSSRQSRCWGQMAKHQFSKMLPWLFGGLMHEYGLFCKWWESFVCLSFRLSHIPTYPSLHSSSSSPHWIPQCQDPGKCGWHVLDSTAQVSGEPLCIQEIHVCNVNYGHWPTGDDIHPLLYWQFYNRSPWSIQCQCHHQSTPFSSSLVWFSLSVNIPTSQQPNM